MLKTLSAAPVRRTYQPIRRRSHLKGREGVFWRPTSRQDLNRILAAAARYDLAGKQPGKRNGPLGLIGLQVLALMVDKINRKTGQLDPAITYFMAKLKRSRDAIVKALRALEVHGFLDRMRRYVPTGNETGPQVVQTSNAYRLGLPEQACGLLGFRGSRSPLPDDFIYRQAEQAAWRDVMMAEMHPVDRAVACVEDEGLAAVLAALGHAMALKKKRESVERSESGSFYMK